MFEEMKEYLENGGDEGQFGYDDPYADYVNDIYMSAISELEVEMNDASIDIEPSIQGGMGRVDMQCKAGSTYWDFETECEILAELAIESETEEEFKNAIKSFLRGKYEECEPEDDDDDEYDEDDDYEGSPDDED